MDRNARCVLRQCEKVMQVWSPTLAHNDHHKCLCDSRDSVCVGGLRQWDRPVKSYGGGLNGCRSKWPLPKQSRDKMAPEKLKQHLICKHENTDDCYLCSTVSRSRRPGKTDELIEMLFEVWICGSLRNHGKGSIAGHIGTCPAVDRLKIFERRQLVAMQPLATIIVATCYYY